MIKVTYYIGMNDKDTLKQELAKIDFIHEFDKIFRDYTIHETQWRFTNRLGEVTFERSLIVTTFIDECTETTLRQHVQHNCSILKDKLNHQNILVEVNKPEVMFL